MKRRIGILTSGGDCPGLNATIRGVAKACYEKFGDELTAPDVPAEAEGYAFSGWKWHLVRLLLCIILRNSIVSSG